MTDRDRAMLLNGFYKRCEDCKCPMVIVDGKQSDRMTVSKDELGIRFMPHTIQCDKK